MKEAKDKILQALARGYCSEKNQNKVLDPDLIDSMANELLPIVNLKPKWIDTSKELPKLKSLYWITDGKDLALSKWSMESMQWHFLFHDSVFKPTHMLLASVPKI